MRSAVPDILSRIVDAKRAEVERLASRLGEMERQAAESVRLRRDFRSALKKPEPALIAEIKQASPSKGLLTEDFRPAETAAAYRRGGASAVSVLTDRKFFRGSLADLTAARTAAGLPVLRKDFTIDTAQIVEAAAHQADAILLIAAILTREELTRFRELASGFGMGALVEVHNEEELEMALDAGAEIVGVNNRNLHTFDVTLDTSLRLAEKMPDGVARVSESGIHSGADVRLLREAGFDAMLVGEHLMRAPDPAAALRALLAAPPGAVSPKGTESARPEAGGRSS